MKNGHSVLEFRHFLSGKFWKTVLKLFVWNFFTFCWNPSRVCSLNYTLPFYSHTLCFAGLWCMSRGWPMLWGQRWQYLLWTAYRVRRKVTAVCRVWRSNPRPLRVGNVTPLPRRTLRLHVLPSATSSWCLPRVGGSAVLSIVLCATWWSIITFKMP